MASDFNTTQLQSPQTVGNDSKTVQNESGKQKLQENEPRDQESLISSQSNGVVFTSASRQNSPTSSFAVSNPVSETGKKLNHFIVFIKVSFKRVFDVILCSNIQYVFLVLTMSRVFVFNGIDTTLINLMNLIRSPVAFRSFTKEMQHP